MQATYCVGCKTRQKERKQKSRQQIDSTRPPRHSLLLHTFGRVNASGQIVSRKRVNICLLRIKPSFAGSAVWFPIWVSMGSGSQHALFPEPLRLPEGFRYEEELLAPDEERALLSMFEHLPFREFEFRGFLGKRRTVSFGWRYGLQCPTTATN